MFYRLFARLSKREQGFTLVEVMASLTILTVIGVSLVNATGSGQKLLSRQRDEMDSRISARQVLTKMVSDIEQAPGVNVVSSVGNTTTGDTIQILDARGIITKVYGYDSSPEKQEIYLQENGVKTFLIHAINLAAFTPITRTGTIADRVQMELTVKVSDSVMTFQDTAMARVAEIHDSPFVLRPDHNNNGGNNNPGSGGSDNIPSIYVEQFNWVPAGASGRDDDDAKDDHGYDSTDSAANVKITGRHTHFSSGTKVVIVKHGAAFDPQNYSATGQTIIAFFNIGDGSNSHNVRVADDCTLHISLSTSDVANNTTYDVWTITPDVLGAGQPEIVNENNAFTVNLGGASHENEGDDSPNKHRWQGDDRDDNQGDWKVDRGNTDGFGSVDDSSREIDKKGNCNDKVLYYNHQVQNFDYQVDVEFTGGGDSHSLALLTLFYNGVNNAKGGTYTGFGIDESGKVYYGEKGSIKEIGSITGFNNRATLRAKTDWDQNAQQYSLRLWVNDVADSDAPLFVTNNVPVSGGKIAPGYLGVTVTDGTAKAAFTINQQ